MNLNLEAKVKQEVPVGAEEAYAVISEFIDENNDLEGIYRIQADEILASIKQQFDSTRESTDRTTDCEE